MLQHAGHRGFLDAGCVDVIEGPVVAGQGLLARLALALGLGGRGAQGGVRPVQQREPLRPGVAPLAQRIGVSGAGQQEVPSDMGEAPQRIDALDRGQRLVRAVEIGGDDQPAASFEGGLLAVDAQHFRGHFGAAGGIHREHGCLIGPEHPQPPAVPVLAGGIGEHPPAGLVGTDVA